MIYGNFTQRLPWKMHLSVFGNYWVSTPSLYSRMDAYGLSNLFWGLNLRRSFLKEDRLSVGINVSNPIRTRHPGYINKSWNDGMTSRSRSYQYRMTSFGVSVSYRFGSLNTSVKKVKKGISNDDVVGGSSGGGGSESQGASTGGN
ncbi:MAG: outer membrane beta-barrel family protein [Muribaculaceae bacterium]|nr:outer membrane beta-barrel family protein [Muribaculaceae bacterium]